MYHVRTGEEVINRPSYRGAGVDIDAATALVEALKPLARSTARSGTAAAIGGFGAVFDPAAAGYRDPLLIASTDGVGTKLKIAILADRHDTVGIDLVAMCVNDLVVQGAEPLFFLDYYATGKLSAPRAESVIAGIAEGCRIAGCALIGGETAELPGMYAGEDYDLAGFSVGAVERDRLITGASIEAGDVVLGLASTGLHSNGFSLVRHVVAELGLAYDGPAPFAGDAADLAAALLRPTRIYVASCLAAHRDGLVKGLAHITGGGLVDNLPRILPDGLGIDIDATSWPLPPVFRWLAGAGGVAPDEMARTFNCGIGMAAVIAPDKARAAADAFARSGETVFTIGRVVDRDATGTPVVAIAGAEQAWRG